MPLRKNKNNHARGFWEGLNSTEIWRQEPCTFLLWESSECNWTPKSERSWPTQDVLWSFPHQLVPAGPLCHSLSTSTHIHGFLKSLSVEKQTHDGRRWFLCLDCVRGCLRKRLVWEKWGRMFLSEKIPLKVHNKGLWKYAFPSCYFIDKERGACDFSLCTMLSVALQWPCTPPWSVSLTVMVPDSSELFLGDFWEWSFLPPFHPGNLPISTGSSVWYLGELVKTEKWLKMSNSILLREWCWFGGPWATVHQLGLLMPFVANGGFRSCGIVVRSGICQRKLP